MDTTNKIPHNYGNVKAMGQKVVPTIVGVIAVMVVVTAVAYYFNPNMFDGAFPSGKKQRGYSPPVARNSDEPAEMAVRDDPVQYLIDPRKQIGFPETKGGVLRNANQQVRAEPIIDKREYTWMNSTIDNEEYGLSVVHT